MNQLDRRDFLRTAGVASISGGLVGLQGKVQADTQSVTSAEKTPPGRKKTKNRVLLIGMDGLMPEQIERYKDDIPELAAFLKDGFFAPAYSSPYTCTATNWPTIATGAWVGTHGCTSFNVHLPGMELGETTPSFNSNLCLAEYFWNAAERQGKRSILINYPCAFPKLLNNGVVIGGDGLHSAQWTVRSADLMQSHPDETFNNKLMPPNRIVLQNAGHWQNVPDDYTVVREGVVRLDKQGKFTWGAAGIQADDSAPEKNDPKAEHRYILIVRIGNETKAIFSSTRNVSDPITVLGAGQWSGWVKENFGGTECLRQYKLLELAEDGSKVSLYGTTAGAVSGWGYPKGIEQEVIANAGGYIEGLELSGSGLLNSGKFDQMTQEIMAIQADWVSNCADYMNKTQDWDSMWIQYHAPDGISHAFLRHLESDDEAVRNRADHMMRETLRILFKMAQKIIHSCADEHTTVCVVSDHGNLPKTEVVMPDVMLHKKAWLVIESFNDRGHPVIDTKKSKACAGAHGVWINLKGREKYGCVEPGQEYENLRSEIINELLAMRHPKTKESLFELVGRREDFQGMGMRGERIDDIIFFPKPRVLNMSDMNLFHTHRDFYESGQDVITLEETIQRGLVWDLTAVHWALPEATVGYASNRPIFLLKGPGVKKNVKGDKRVNLVDVSSTLAHVLDIRPPQQAEGRIVWEAFKA